MPRENGTETHFKPLDGIRGFAILAVFCVHYGAGVGDFHNPALRALGIVFSMGWFGVDLFFVLSGFLITGILLRSLDSPRYFRTFYARRTLRIFPIYYAVLIGLLMASPLFHYHWRAAQFSFFLYAQNFALVFGHSRLGAFGPFSAAPYWSLAVEEQFYLIWPALILLCRRKLPALIIVALCLPFALRFLCHNPEAIYNLMYYRFDELAMGALLAWAFRTGWPQRHRPWAPLAVSSIGLCVLMATTRSRAPENWWMQHAGFTLLALGSAGTIWATYTIPVFNRVFSAAWLRFFGRISYGFYVYHYLPEPWARRIVLPWLVRELHLPLLAWAVFFFGFLGLITLVSWASYEFFEKQVLKLKRYFEYAPPAQETLASINVS